jgi:integrase
MTRAQPPLRKPRTPRLTYQALAKLRPGKTLTDPLTTGLRFCCVASSTGGRHHVYAEWRGMNPITKKRDRVELGRLPRPDELSPAAFAEVKLEGRVIERRPMDHMVIEPFRQAARECQRKVRAGLDVKSTTGAEGITLRQALVRHAQRMRNKGKSSITEYEWHVHRYLGDWIDVPLRKLTREMVQGRHEKIGKKSGPYAANRMMRYLRAIWNTAMRLDKTLEVSPTIAVEMYKETRRDAAIPLRQLPKWFTEVNRLKNPVIRDLLLLTVLTGLRKATVCAIRRDHINLLKGTLFIPKPKGGADRAYTIPLSDSTMVIVERRLSATNSEWLFPGSGKSGHIHDPRSDKLKVEFTIHGLRNTYISAASTAGVSPYHSKLLSNHALPKNEVHAGYVSKDVDALRSSQQRITDFLREHGLPV